MDYIFLAQSGIRKCLIPTMLPFREERPLFQYGATYTIYKKDLSGALCLRHRKE